MLGIVAPFSALLLSAAFLLLGLGLQGTLVPIRADIDGFSSSAIGLIGSAYYLGFVLGCLLGPYFVARAGHIRAFAAFAVIAAIAALLFPIISNEYVWVVLRALNGLSMAGLYMVIESWLNERSSAESRAQVFSVYTVINLSMVTVGQMLVVSADPASSILFSMVAILVCLGVLPVVLSTAIAPVPIEPVKLDLKMLYRLSPAGVIGCFCVGLANSVLWSIGPVYAMDAGLSTSGVASFIALATIGGALLQWPLGRLSDQIDRRKVMLLCCILAAAGGIGLALIGFLPRHFIYVFAFLFGSFAIPIYALSVAHANDYVTGTDFVVVSSGLLLVFGLGAVTGPVIASILSEQYGFPALFYFTTTVHLACAVLIFIRIRQQAPLPADERPDFVSVSNTTTSVFTLDPRAEEGDDAADPTNNA